VLLYGLTSGYCHLCSQPPFNRSTAEDRSALKCSRPTGVGCLAVHVHLLLVSQLRHRERSITAHRIEQYLSWCFKPCNLLVCAFSDAICGCPPWIRQQQPRSSSVCCYLASEGGLQQLVNAAVSVTGCAVAYADTHSTVQHRVHVGARLLLAWVASSLRALVWVLVSGATEAAAGPAMLEAYGNLPLQA
jgi:hypothetical protein